MKSKKLFAILTLVVFMMTLLPMSAFADAADRFASFYQVNKTSVTADGVDKVKVEIYLQDSSNQAASDTHAFIATHRGTTDKFYADSSLTQQIPAAQYNACANVYAITSTSGKATVYIASTVAGTSKVAVGLTNNSGATNGSLYEYLSGTSTATAAAVNLVGSTTDITFTPGSVSAVSAYDVTDNVTGKSFSVSGTGTAVELSSATGSYAQGNGSEYYELQFKATASGGAPVKDAEMVFSVSDPALSLNVSSTTTDAAGIGKVKVTATKGFTSFSDYVQAKVGDKSCKWYVKFDPNAPFKVELTSGGNETVAKDKPYTLKFKVYDLNGNQIKCTGSTTATTNAPQTEAGTITFEATTRPTDVKLPEKLSEASTTAADAYIQSDSSGQFVLTLTGASLNKEGDYNIKAYLANGAYVNVPFKVKKQGTVTKMTLSYDSSTVAMGGITSKATIRYYDAENIVEKVSDNHTNVVFSVSPAPVATSITQASGEIATLNSKDYKGTFTVFAVNNDKKLSASTTLMMTREVATVKVLSAPNAAPGTASKVEIQLYDIDNVATAFGTSATVSLDQKVVTASPKDSIVTVSASSDFQKNLRETGKSTIDVKCTKAGDVIVDAVIKATIGGVDKYYPVQIPVKFVEATPVVGAKKVTMFIGATGYVQDGAAKVTDVAPFIENGRTFVAVRPVADAFGAEIAYDDATKTVTLTRSDRTVTIVIGSSTITVVKGGVTSTVTADVAAQIKNGRTVLPFRAVGEAFEATVGYDAATQAVTYEQK